MDVLTLAMWIGTAIFLIFSFAKNKGKTKQALKMAFGMGKGMPGKYFIHYFFNRPDPDDIAA